MNPANCGIYIIESKETGRQYVGQSSRMHERRKNHFGMLRNNKHPNKYLQRTYNKYGPDDLTFYLLEECRPDQLDQKEIAYIKAFDCMAPKGFNMAAGGGGRNTTGPMKQNQKDNISKAKTQLFLSCHGLISIKEAHRISGVKPQTLYARLYRGLTLDQAMVLHTGYGPK